MAIRTGLSKKCQIRFWQKVQIIPFHPCWEWVAAKNDSGYGVFGVGKQTDKAHRIAYRLAVGEIPMGQFIMHSCDNPGCVNPAHLIPGTNKDNVNDMITKGRNSLPPPMGGWNRINLPESIISRLGTLADTDLAREIGVSKSVIRRARKSRYIKAFPCQTRFKSGTPHPRWGRKGVS